MGVVETLGGDASKTGLIMKKGGNKSSTSIGASLTRTLSLCHGDYQHATYATCRHYILCGCVRAHGYNKSNGVVDQT